jgi:RNA polymerase sigma-70 factor (ECF subfamily)
MPSDAVTGTSDNSPGVGAAELEHVFANERGRIQGYLATLVGAADAEDLVQEAFTRAHQARASYLRGASIASWVRRIARNVAIDHLRRGAAAPVATRPLDDEDATVVAREADPERRVIRAEMRSCIVNLVRTLPERDADVIVLGDLRGLKDQEVADALGITLGAAKICLHRARARLRRMMNRSCELYRDEDGLACDRRS